MAGEQCPPETIVHSSFWFWESEWRYQTPNCGAFFFDHKLDNWTDRELWSTQNFSTKERPWVVEDTSGLRLIVYYNGPTLTEGVAIESGIVGEQALPVGNTVPYYGADHVYTIPRLPSDRWQAVVARGLAPVLGTDPPSHFGLDNAYRIYPRGSLPMEVHVDDSQWGGMQGFERTLQTVEPIGKEAGYVLFNGRGAPGQATNTPLQLRVSTASIITATGGEKPQGYDVRLIREQPESFNPTVGTTQVFYYEFASADPLALWNLKLTPGTVNRIQITVDSDGTDDPYDYRDSFASKFHAQVVHSTHQETMPVSTGGEGTVTKWPLQKEPTSSGYITAETGQYALAIAYHGPNLKVYDHQPCGVEICTPGVIKIKYSLSIAVTSCQAGTFPTLDGGCQQVECPNTTTFVANANTYQDVGSMRLWSKSGWNRTGNTGESVASGVAPLIGPPGDNAPTVAVVGGRLSYQAGASNVVSFGSPGIVMLVQCPPLNSANGAYQKTFDLFEGLMQSDPSALLLSPTASSANQILRNPWPDNDQVDLSARDFWVAPLIGLASGSSRLRRTVDEAGATRDLHFTTSWTWTVDGWPSLDGSVSALSGNPQPPTVASLLVGLGDKFSLDTEPADGQNQRRFTGLRATNGTVTQPDVLGGASKPVQVVILPRDKPLPVLNQLCPASCLDLRGRNDTPNLVTPDREREMPDIHTNTAAKTVMMNSTGGLTVYSTDHPNIAAANAADFSQEFSFDAYKAKVTIDYAPCGGVGPSVLIIRGETRMALPNIGAGGAGGAMEATFTLCETSLRAVHLSFEAPVGIPIGASGLFLTGLRGDIAIYPAYTTITIGLNFQAQPSGDGGAFKAQGNVTIDTRGLFEFQGSGKVLGTVDVDGKIWVAWNPLDTGFQVNLRVGDWLQGFARAHLWQGQGWQHRYHWLPDDNTQHFAGQIGATLTIQEGAILDWWLITVPPFTISIRIEVAFGEFCTNGDCTTYEWGIKGKISILGYDVGIYYGFDRGLDFILGNDDHVLIDQHGGYVLAAGSAGDDTVLVQAAPLAVNGIALIPFTVSPNAEQILVGVSWQAGAPQFSLLSPDGVEINAANATSFGAQVGGTAHETILTVQTPKPGAWQAKIANLSDKGIEHYKLLYLASKGAPGLPGSRGQFVNPAGANEPGTDAYTIRWSAPADTSDKATISLYYYRTVALNGNLQQGVPIVKNLPFKSGSYLWNTTGLLNGAYQIRAEVDDGVNDLPLDQISQPNDTCLPANSGLPKARAFDTNRFPGTVVFTTTGTIAINDLVAPSAPTGLQVSGVDGAIMARWTPAGGDVNAYLLYWGPKNPSALLGFEAKNQALVAATAMPVYRIGAVTNNLPYGVAIVALDVNGNPSSFATTQFVTPSVSGNPIPPMPENLTLTGRTSTSASFTWTVATGSAPTSYRVTYTRLDAAAASAHLDVSSTSATLNGLATGATYAVIVAAANSDGWYSDNTAPIQVLITNEVDGNNDSMADDWANHYGVIDGNADNDSDGLSNAIEYTQGSNPLLQDSDGDGFSDAEEKVASTDPLDSVSYGAEQTQPRLTLSGDKLTFKAKRQTGGDAAIQAVAWANIGGGNLQLQASSSQSWINAKVVTDTVQVGVNHNSLAPGFYSGVVRLNTASSSNPLIGEPLCIRINAWVLPADDDMQTPPVMDKIIWLPIISQ